jgi:ADP-ribosylglycohydrolase
MTERQLDRFRGTVIGAAVGDALGYPIEFVPSMNAIRSRFGEAGITGYVDLREIDGKRVALYSDDTQMAMVVLQTLTEARRAGEDLDATMRRMAAGFVEWSTDPPGGHRAPGNACLAGCRRLAAGELWYRAGAPDAGGCGSVMRAYPFGLLLATDPSIAESWAVAHSRLTHGAAIAFAACAAQTIGVAHAHLGDEPAVILSEMVKSAARYDVQTADMIEEAVRSAVRGVPPEPVLEKLQGWAAHEAIAAAAYVFARHPDDFQKSVLEAANSPGDSDSIATLVGALVGARRGLGAIPSAWIAPLENRDQLLQLADVAAQVCRAP